jgi:hypothetical protein
LKDTYSIKKTKDLVNPQIEKYKKLASTTLSQQGSPTEEFLTEDEKQKMNDDLMDFANSISNEKLI